MFDLKLDECQVVKGQILERVRLTLMSQTLKEKPLEIQELDTTQDNNEKCKRHKQDY